MMLSAYDCACLERFLTALNKAASENNVVICTYAPTGLTVNDVKSGLELSENNGSYFVTESPQ